LYKPNSRNFTSTGFGTSTDMSGQSGTVLLNFLLTYLLTWFDPALHDAELSF